MIDKFKIEHSIKYYRKLINVTQKELAFKDISLAHIKLLESNKRRLTIETAKIISNNLNILVKEKNMNLHVTPEELLTSEIDLLHSLYEKEIENLDLTFQNKSKIESIIESCDYYSLNDLKIKLFKNQGDYYVTKYKYKEAIEIYKNALKIEENPDIELTLYLLNRIGACYHELGDLTLSIKNYTISENLLLTKLSNKEINSEILFKLYYGQAVNYNKLTEYEISIEYINKILNLKHVDEKWIINTKMLLGNIYYRIKKIDDAITLYEELNTFYPNNYNIKINLTMLYDSIGNKELSKKIFKDIDSTVEKTLNFAVMDLLNRKNLSITKNKNFALQCLDKALDLSLKHKSIDSIIKIFNHIVKDFNNNCININDVKKYLCTLDANKNESIFNNNVKQRLNKTLIKLLLNPNIDNECKNIISNILGGD